MSWLYAQLVLTFEAQEMKNEFIRALVLKHTDYCRVPVFFGTNINQILVIISIPCTGRVPRYPRHAH